MDSLSSDQVQRYVVSYLKGQYAAGLSLVKRLERENRDARQRGVSFTEREALYGSRIRAAQRELSDIERRGKEATSERFWPDQIGRGLSDECLVEFGGYEGVVRVAYDLYDRFGLSTGELSPVKV